MFNSETGNSGESAAEILRKAREKAVEKRVGAYTIAVRVNGQVQEAKDEAELNRYIGAGAAVEYHGILVDGKGGIVQ